ncbi:hypothetical protein QJS66_12610 [Kocuria rhizophila]|nr:hypothetical protein QJS66_12610 [Kocuria rhizophila]
MPEDWRRAAPGDRAADGRSYAARQFHEGARRRARTTAPAGHLHGGQPGWRVPRRTRPWTSTWRPGASLALTDAVDGSSARPRTRPLRRCRRRLRPGSVLEHVPDQLIVYRGGSYIQRTLGGDGPPRRPSCSRRS